MVSFDPISLLVEGVSQIGIYFIDSNTKKSVEESKRLQLIYEKQAEESKDDAELYALLTIKIKQQKEQTTLLTKQVVQQNKAVVYTVWFVFILAFLLILWVFKIAFSLVKKSL